jgi:hypothetical protein
VEYLYYSIENKVFEGNNIIIALKQQLLGIILYIYAFKMALATASLRENAVEAI